MAEPADAQGWYAWRTDSGMVRARGEVDLAQSRREGATVVHVEWWFLPDTHHAGWWRCDTRRPRDWTKGRG